MKQMGDHEPTSHGPTDHEPTSHGPTDHGPTDHEPTDHEPTDHEPTDHEPTSHAPTSHAHEHEHEHESLAPFPHEKLDAYRIALKMAVLAQQIAAAIPRGHRSIADHLLRSAANVVLLLAEGANRRGAAEKRQRFVESRGECGEVAAAADLVVALCLANPTQAKELKYLAARVAAMLTGLVVRLG